MFSRVDGRLTSNMVPLANLKGAAAAPGRKVMRAKFSQIFFSQMKDLNFFISTIYYALLLPYAVG